MAEREAGVAANTARTAVYQSVHYHNLTWLSLALPARIQPMSAHSFARAAALLLLCLGVARALPSYWVDR